MNDNGGTYNSVAFAATDTVAGVGSQSTASASLEGATPSLTYYSGTSATGTALSGAPTTAGTYTVLASFAGSTDYTSGMASTTFTIVGSGVGGGIPGGGGVPGGGGDSGVPVITSAISLAGATTFQGTLTGVASTQYQINFDQIVSGQGPVLLGSQTFTTNSAGSLSFTATLPQYIPIGSLVSATATNVTLNNTSSLGADMTVAAFSENFSIGADNQVYSQLLSSLGSPASTNANLTTVGGVLAMEVANDGAGNPLVFVIGQDNQVYVQRFDANGNSLGGYWLVSAGTVSSINVGYTAAGLPELFVIGKGTQPSLGLANQQVSVLQFSAAGVPSGTYSPAASGAIQSLVVAHDAAGDPLTFVIGMDNEVYEDVFNSSGVSTGGYTLVQPGQVSSIAVTYTAANDPELLAIATSNDNVYSIQFAADGTPTTGFTLTAPGAVKSLSVSIDASGNSVIFVTGMDNQVWLQPLNASGNSVAPTAWRVRVGLNRLSLGTMAPGIRNCL